MELRGFRVKFVSANDIKKFYEKHHPGYDETKVDIYEMTKFFIKMHKGSSFFLDEVPFIDRYGKLQFKFWPVQQKYIQKISTITNYGFC